MNQWPSRRLGAVAEVRLSSVDKVSSEGELSVSLCNYIDVYTNRKITSDLPFMVGSATRAEVDHFELRRGDVLITKDSEAWTDIGVPAFVAEDLPNVVCGYHLALIRPRPAILSGRFLVYALLCPSVTHSMSAAAVGITRFGLTSLDIRTIRVPVPPLKEQERIADELDRETALIQSVISKRRDWLVACESRFAALAEGLIRPFDRKREPLKRVAGGVTVGVVVNPSTYVDPDGEVLFFRGIDVCPYELLLDRAQRISHSSNADLAKSRLRAGDIVSVRDGEPGTSAVVPKEAEGANCASLLITRRSSRIESSYLCHVFNSPYGRNEFAKLAYGAAQKHVNVSDAVQFQVPIPSLDEQRDIAQILDAAWARLAAIRSSVAAQMERFSEHKRAMIAAEMSGSRGTMQAASYA